MHRRVGVEGPAKVEPDQDLCAGSFEVVLEPHRIVAGVEDEQRCFAATETSAELTAYERPYLFAGRVVGVFFGRDAPRVHKGDPRIARGPLRVTPVALKTQA